MTDTLVLCLLKRVHKGYHRWPIGYHNNHLAYHRVQRINRMSGLPGRFRLDDHGHICFHHHDGRILHPHTLAWYRANGAVGLRAEDLSHPYDEDCMRRCKVLWS